MNYDIAKASFQNMSARVRNKGMDEKGLADLRKLALVKLLSDGITVALSRIRGRDSLQNPMSCDPMMLNMLYSFYARGFF